MARTQARPRATQQVALEPVQTICRGCGSQMQMARHSHRPVTTLQAVTHLTVKVYQCPNTTCPRFHQATRPEEEGRWAAPQGEFGLDVIALVGALRYQEQRSIPQIHQELQRRGVQIARRTVTDQLYRYEELLALHLADVKRLRERLEKQEQVILALDGLQPDVGHEVLWVLRDCLSYEHLLSTMTTNSEKLGELAHAVTHFCKVTASYWEGLFACYQLKDLPRTNNGLEQYFGSARHGERRATGRKRASPALVVRGAVRVVAAGASRLLPISAIQLQVTDEVAWRALRQQLTYRHECRRCQLRFRRDPDVYLAALEHRLLTPSLPS